MAIGDVVATLSVSGASGPETFELVQNPGGYFEISGSEILQAIDLPPGVYSIDIEATGSAGATRQFVVKHSVPPPGVFVIGVNLSGGQTSGFLFPSAASINYYAGKSIKLIRLPFSWPLAQPEAFGALDPTYMGQTASVVASAVAAGSTCILDNHGFGIGPGGLSVGSAGLPTTAFADLWGKVAAYFVAQPALLPGIDGLDLMNEWPNGFDSGIVFTASQQAITAIRAAGYAGKIYVEGVNFSSAWNWTSGQGNPFNSSGLSALTDPSGNLVFQPHMYPDPDDSGTNYSYASATSIAGSAPPGINTNVNIGVQRMSREFVPWLASNRLRGLVGEYGSSGDNPWSGGAFDYADWNALTRNLLTYLQANNIAITLWAGGPGFGAGYGPNAYGYSLDPFNVNLSGAADFTATGVQAAAMVVLDDFTGYSGAQPQAYMLFAPGLTTPHLHCTVGSPSSPFTVYYGGKITSPVTITPHAFLADGTPAGGTFTPPSIVLAPGENGLATFTYTASQVATLTISTTNSFGWHDPPPIGISSIVDGYVALPGTPSNIYGMFNRYTPNIGPALRLQRLTDGQQRDWFLTLPNSGHYGGFDRNAIQTWASQRFGIPVVTRYDMSGLGNHLTFGGATLPTLNLNNAAGYPEIDYASGCQGVFNTPINGQTQFYTIARFNQNASAVSGIYRMDWFNGPIQWGQAGSDTFTIVSTGQPPPATPVPQNSVNTSLSFGLVTGAYHDYGVSYSSGVTNGFVTYKDGTQVAAATVTYELGAGGQTSVNFASFRFSSASFVGSDYNMEIGQGFTLTAAQHASISTIDATYYATALPDTLAAVTPTIIGAAPSTVLLTSFPFSAVTVLDQNAGTPTDSVSITLTGTAATLAGSGISGSNPYTIAAASAASITSIMQTAMLSTSATSGAVDISFTVTSSAGASSTSNACVVTVQAVAPAETPFPAPVGTFTPINLKGVNLSDADINYPAVNQFVYIYPQNTEIDYWSSKGMGLIRVGVSQSRLQPRSFGPLDPVAFIRSDGLIGRSDEPAANADAAVGVQTNLAALKRILDHAFSKNMYVVFDLHNGGGIEDNQNNVFRFPDDPLFSPIFNDWWVRIATKFKNYPNAIWGLFNEPQSGTAAGWQAIAASATSAIAAVTTQQIVFWPGIDFTGALTWTSNGSAAAWAGYVPPAGITGYIEIHQYLNHANNGFTADVDIGKGAACLDQPTTGLVTTWARAHGFKLWLGETGWSPSDAVVSPGTGVPSTEGAAIMHFMTTNNDVWKGWAYWLGGSVAFENTWNNNLTQPAVSVFCAVPEGYPTGPFTDAPQTSILVANL